MKLFLGKEKTPAAGSLYLGEEYNDQQAKPWSW